MSSISTLSRSVGKFLTDNSPKILMGVSVAGVITTAVLAVRATPEAIELIDEERSRQYRETPVEERESFDAPLKKLDIIKVAWQPYIPAVAMGAITITCIVLANKISTKREAALVGLYSLTDTAFREYREKTVEQVGATKEQKIRDEIAKDHVTSNPPSNGIVIVGTDQLCYDQLTGRYFKSDMQKLRKAENDINQKIINEMYASQNDFYRLIPDLDIVDFGDEYGWNTDMMLDLDFTAVMTKDDRPCIAMNYRMAPIRGYYASSH